MKVPLLLIFVFLLGTFAQNENIDKKSEAIKSSGKNTKSRFETLLDKERYSKSGSKIDKNPKLNEADPQSGASEEGGESPERREWLQLWEDARQFIADSLKKEQVGFRRKVSAAFLSAERERNSSRISRRS